MIVAGEQSRRALRDAGDRPLLLSATGGPGDRSATELLERVAGVARALSRRDATRQRIGLWLENSAAAVEAHLAVEWVGGARVPVDPAAPAAEAAAVFEAAGVHLVVTDGVHAGPIDALVHDDEAPLAAAEPDAATAVEPVTVESTATHLLYPRMAAGGQMLAVPVSYANWQAQMELNLRLHRDGWYGPALAEDDVAVTAQQLLHGTGLVTTFPFLLAGLPQVVLPRFDAGGFIEATLRHRATSTFFVPGMVSRVADALPAGTRLSLRRVLYGGAPFPVDDLRAAVARLGPVLVQLYGRFEGGWPLTVLGPEDHARIAAGDDELAASCGRAVPGVELELRDVGAPPAGELRVRGPTVVAEYADPDGWCALGDLMQVDAHGHFFHRGRLDGMINTGSYHVYPAEVEAALAELPGVTAALVRGEADPVWGQAVTAYVTAEPQVDPDELRRGLRRRLAPYKVPKRIAVVDRLPS